MSPEWIADYLARHGQTKANMLYPGKARVPEKHTTKDVKKVKKKAKERAQEKEKRIYWKSGV